MAWGGRDMRNSKVRVLRITEARAKRLERDARARGFQVSLNHFLILDEGARYMRTRVLAPTLQELDKLVAAHAYVLWLAGIPTEVVVRIVLGVAVEEAPPSFYSKPPQGDDEDDESA